MKNLPKMFLLISLLALTCASCKRAVETEFPPTEQMDGELPFTKICRLKNYPEMVGAISRLSFLDPEHFIIVSNAASQVLIFNKKGEQVRFIGNKGRGEFEFLSPDLVRVHDDRIFIWCNQLLKLIIFAHDGNPLNEIFFQRAIKDFVVWENLMCIYTSAATGEVGPMLKIYDMNLETFVGQGFGEVTNEHQILTSHHCAGGLALFNHYVYFSPIDRPKVYRINLKNFSKTYFQITDPDFVLEKVATPAHEFAPNPLVAIPYVFGSDIAEDLYAFNNYIVLMASVGDMKFEGMTLVDYSARRQVLYFLNHDLQPKRKIMSLPLKFTNACLLDTSQDGLYAIKFDPVLTTYGLYRLNLPGN
ncbi:MAG TPA: hypothetical protein DCM62_01590 [Bacteroidales bacterium]|nr:hypothetical protein [Bacteroidales bacterium]